MSQQMDTGYHGDDISDQEGGRFYPETWVKTPAKISPLKGKNCHIGIMWPILGWSHTI